MIRQPTSIFSSSSSARVYFFELPRPGSSTTGPSSTSIQAAREEVLRRLHDAGGLGPNGNLEACVDGQAGLSAKSREAM